MTIVVQNNDFPATAEGLLAIAALKGGLVTELGFKFEKPLPEDVIINFGAFIQKSLKHTLFILGAQNQPNTKKRIWRQYWKNSIDLQRGTGGLEFLPFLAAYVKKNQTFGPDIPLWQYDGVTLKVITSLKSKKAAAVAAGRLVNVLRWCESYTQCARLVTDTGISWGTFNKISLDQEYGLGKKKK